MQLKSFYFGLQTITITEIISRRNVLDIIKCKYCDINKYCMIHP